MKLYMLVFVVFITGCAAVDIGPKSNEMNKVSMGMSKDEVLSGIGQPSRVSANEEVEYLIYRLVDDVDYTVSSMTLGLAPPETQKSDYFVKLKNNKVVSYGRVGDFGTSIEPASPNKRSKVDR
ncbi:MAG: hypothetical protein V3T17_15505 [Pseudomonadales bacterium]